MATLKVGQGQSYATLSSAVADARDGDVIEVQAGTYVNDFATISRAITIRGVGGTADLVATVAPDNGKAILVTRANVTIENLSFSGARVPDENGAGIRAEKGDLTLRNTTFHHNEMGILGGDPQGSITIERSEFAFNGLSSGFAHNIYVTSGRFAIRDSSVRDVIGGHQIKSRSPETIIENNRIEDGATGTGSYSIDVPQGGNVRIAGNYIEKGPQATNVPFIHVGQDGALFGNSNLNITGNTFVNDYGPGAMVLFNEVGVPARIEDNGLFQLALDRIVFGAATVANNHVLQDRPGTALQPVDPGDGLIVSPVDPSPALPDPVFIPPTEVSAPVNEPSAPLPESPITVVTPQPDEISAVSPLPGDEPNVTPSVPLAPAAAPEETATPWLLPNSHSGDPGTLGVNSV